MRTEANSIQLAKRLLECKHFRWMPGMTVNPVVRWPRGFIRLDARIVAVDPKRAPWTTAGYLDHGEWLPDLEDDATKGCLLRLVRDAWGCPYAKTSGGERISEDVWKCLVHDGTRYQTFKGTTEAAALVAALEGAP